MRASACRGNQHEDDLAEVGRDEIANGFANVDCDGAAALDGVGQRREIVFEQYDVRDAARGLPAGASESDADIRRAQRRRVVDAIADHCDDPPAALQLFDQLQLLPRRTPREYPWEINWGQTNAG